MFENLFGLIKFNMEIIVKKDFLRYFALLLITISLPACNVLNQKDPDVIVTTEPMLTKSEEGEVDTVVSAESINLDYNEEKGYTLGNNIIYFDYDKYSVEKNEDIVSIVFKSETGLSRLVAEVSDGSVEVKKNFIKKKI